MKSVLATFIICVSVILQLGVWAGEVNINQADAETIASELKGIGLSKAKAIVEYRDEHGRFAHPDELLQVKGIGLRTVEINRDNIKLGAKSDEVSD